VPKIYSRCTKVLSFHPPSHNFELANRYDPDPVQTGVPEKFDPETVVTAVYYDCKSKHYNVKCFRIDNPKEGRRLPFTP